MGRFIKIQVKCFFKISIGCSDDSGPAEPAEKNTAPTISNIAASLDTVEFSATSQLTCTATDPNGDNMTYAWAASSGSFIGTGSVVNWKAPYCKGDFFAWCTVRDGRGGSDVDSVGITVIMPDGFIAYFPFAGNAEDASGNSNDGTVFGATPAEDRFGVANSAYYFDGSTAYISITNSGNMSPTDAVSVTAWLKTDAIVGTRMIVYDRIETNDGFGLLLADSGYPRVSINGGEASCVSTINVADQAWHHVAGTYDSAAGEINIYVDGVLAGTTAYSTPIDYDPEPRNQIGRTLTGTDYFRGTIDDLSIFDRALSAAEVLRYAED